MKRALEVFVFLAVYVLDVRVKAETVDPNEALIFWPSHCYNKTLPCTVKNLTKKSKLVHLGVEMSLSLNATVTLATQGVTLVSGILLIENNSNINVKTLYSDIKVNGAVLLKVTGQSIEITSLEGISEARRRGDEVFYSIPPGYTYIIGAVNSKGVADFEFPQSASFVSVVNNWSSLSYMTKPKFTLKAQEFRVSSINAGLFLSKTYKTIIERRIASHRKMLKRRQLNKVVKQKEIEGLRALFRKKNYLE